jgi:hypothetical protein
MAYDQCSDPESSVIMIVRGDDRRVLFTIDSPWPGHLTGFLRGRLTARGRGRTWGSAEVALDGDRTIVVDLRHWMTDQLAGVYAAELELIFDGGPEGPPGDPRSGEQVWTPWQGHLVLLDDLERSGM